MNSSRTYQRANIWISLFYLLISPKRYLEIATIHSIAINIEAPDMKKKYNEGTYQPDYNETLSAMTIFRNELFKSISKSLLAVSATIVIAIIFAYMNGFISTSLPLSLQKTLQVISTCLLMWAALFKLGWGIRTISGEALHELLHGLLFNIILIIGSFLTLISLLI